MADLVLKCSLAADPQQPIELPCPAGYSLILQDESQDLLVGGDLAAVVGTGASAILIPFLIGISFAAAKKIFERM